MEIVKGKINAILGEGNLNNIKMIDSFKKYDEILVLDYIKNSINGMENKIEKALKIVNLKSNILKLKMNDLADSEKVKVELAIKLIVKDKTIYLNYFDAYFMSKDLDYFKKLFKKIVKNYKITLVFINTSMSYLINLVDVIFVINDGKITKFSSKEFFNNDIHIDKYPKIVEFIKYVNSNGKVIENYCEMEELIKGIYREV